MKAGVRVKAATPHYGAVLIGQRVHRERLSTVMQAGEYVLAFRLCLEAKKHAPHVFGDRDGPAAILPFQPAPDLDGSPESALIGFLVQVDAIPLQGE